MSRKQAYVYFYASYSGKIYKIRYSDIFMFKIGIPDKSNLFATLNYLAQGGGGAIITTCNDCFYSVLGIYISG